MSSDAMASTIRTDGPARTILGLLALACVLASLASPAAGEPPKNPEPAFLVSKLTLVYARENVNQIPLSALKGVEILLPSPGAPVRLDTDLGKPLSLRAGDIRRVCEEVVRFLNGRGLVGVIVAPSQEDIDPRTMKDLRPPGRTALRLVVWAGRVTSVTATALPGQSAAASRPAPRIAADSPVRPATPAEPGALNLLRKDLLDEYVALLNRHPGRQVDVAVTPAGEGDVALEYRVSQSQAPIVYAQVGNTGPRSTGSWRERLGIINNQLTGNDDILSLEYATAGFDDEHAVVTSYEAPVGRQRRLRWRIYGSYSYSHSDEAGSASTQREGLMGGELIANVFQHRDLFLDVVVGAGGRVDSARDEGEDTHGEAGFLTPYAGLRAEQLNESRRIWASAIVERACALGADGDDLAGLGRYDPDSRWWTLKYGGGASFFLDPPTPASPNSPRAHEIATLVNGQYAGGYRLVPQAQGSLGGLYSVRGYPEAVAAGDSVLAATAEYRCHVPRLFAAQPEPGKTRLFDRPFRFSPQEPLGRADWDLIARTFFDAGRSFNARRNDGEYDETLMSWGVGLELQIRQNFSIRCDWGMALKDLRSGLVDAGDDRFHILATFSW